MTHFNIVTGTAVVPLLARLVLCCAFFTAGWNKLMNVQEFHGRDAHLLIERGVADVVRTTPRAQPAATVSRAAIDQPPNEADAPANEDDPPRPQQRPIVEPPPDVIEEDPITGERVLIAKRLHGVTLMLIERGWQGAWPIWLASLLTFTELVGAALLLVGLFSRVWAFGLAVAMTIAFSMTTWPPLATLGPFGIAADITGGYAAFHAMYAQLGLLTLALVVVLAGPGPVSLDRLLFRPRSEETFNEEFV